MRGRWKWLLLWTATIAGAAIVAVGTRETEPEYGGRKLSDWVGCAGGSGADESRAFGEAIRHIGTNAVPLLVKWVAYQPPAWKVRLHATVNPLLARVSRRWKLTDSKAVRASGVSLAFRALGPDAAEAAPRLSRFLHDRANSKASRQISMSLGALGKDALPYLMSGIVDDQADVRVSSMVGIVLLGTNARPALPLLIGRLKDGEAAVASRAASCLGRLGIGAASVVPALAEALQDKRPLVRQQAAGALRAFGGEARPALPMLVACFMDEDPYVARTAMAAAGDLKLEPALVVPALVDNLNDPRAYIPNAAALALGEFGPESQAATPVLLDLLRNPDQTIRDSARSALAKIDPQSLDSMEREGK